MNENAHRTGASNTAVDDRDKHLQSGESLYHIIETDIGATTVQELPPAEVVATNLASTGSRSILRPHQ